jgi:hypothetical protein
MPLLAMRVELPDEPNSLARIAGTLGTLGANIVDIEVHELEGSLVVDEVLIDAPEDASPDAIRQGLLEAGATDVVAVSTDRRQMDAVVRCLDGVASMLAEPDDESLVAAVASVVVVDEAAITPIAELDHLDTGGARLRWGIPVTQRLIVGDFGHWVLALPRTSRAPVPTDALVVSRAGLRFSATEVARLRALVRVHSYMSGRVVPDHYELPLSS